jgi:HSP20 family molecular chaperone IbpA
LETLRHEMDRLFERTFPKMFGYEMEAEREWQPGLDVRETENAYVVETDLPGMAAENITVEVEGPYVVVRAPSNGRDSREATVPASVGKGGLEGRCHKRSPGIGEPRR